jgi:L-alanine-DL-glutamate epimerase-like enolase superfamily enzyme
MKTDARVQSVELTTEDFHYRTPIRFGGVSLDRVTLLHAAVDIELGDGRVQRGTGSMPLGNAWAWPSPTLGYDETLGAMRAVADGVAAYYAGCTVAGHPVEITHAMEPHFPAVTETVMMERKLAEPIPPLVALVAASPIDAALHDAYAKALGLNAFRTLTAEFLRPDLGDLLGPEFAGRRLNEFVRDTPAATLPVYHLVGALDPLTPVDVTNPVGDGLPESLADWVRADGLTHLKIKLSGDKPAWDLQRILGVNEVAEAARTGGPWAYSLDFNEKCPDESALVELLRKLGEKSPAALERVQYVEQPTARDLAGHPHQTMHAAAKLKPVVIDESLLDLESLKLAREMGYTGAAFKACKGQTQTLLLAAAAQVYGLFRCVQDLTCPGASLVQSAALAAHIPGVAAIEANARQYVPAANEGWDARFPGLFTIRNGIMPTGQLTGVGLGATPADHTGD